MNNDPDVKHCLLKPGSQGQPTLWWVILSQQIPWDTIETDDAPKDNTPGSNQGKLLVDATCTPADITFPTDVKLLNEAREETEELQATKRQHRQDEIDRIAVEGKFGQGKRRFTLNRIMAKLSETSEAVIMVSFVKREMKNDDRQVTASYKGITDAFTILAM